MICLDFNKLPQAVLGLRSWVSAVIGWHSQVPPKPDPILLANLT